MTITKLALLDIEIKFRRKFLIEIPKYSRLRDELINRKYILFLCKINQRPKLVAVIEYNYDISCYECPATLNAERL